MKKFLGGRKRGYQAAWKVEKWRPQAEQLRREDPELYQRILGEATGEAAAAAQEDPDAFVALWLEAANSIGESESTAPSAAGAVEAPSISPSEARDDEYVAVAHALMEDKARRKAVPKRAEQYIAFFFVRYGGKGANRKFARQLAQNGERAFVVADAEDWSTVDRGEFRRVANDYLRGLGSEDADAPASSPGRQGLLLAGFANPEGNSPVIAYVSNMPAWQRLRSLEAHFDQLGIRPSWLREKDLELFEHANGITWRVGLGCGFLHAIGELA